MLYKRLAQQLQSLCFSQSLSKKTSEKVPKWKKTTDQSHAYSWCGKFYKTNSRKIYSRTEMVQEKKMKGQITCSTDDPEGSKIKKS